MNIKQHAEGLVSGPLFQPVWQSLLKVSLHRMNYGRGSFIDTSGERWVLRYIADRLTDRERIILFDVGANKGQYTAQFLKRAGKDRVEAYCFEPDRTGYEDLLVTHAINPRVHCINLGMSDSERKTILYDNGSVYNQTPPYGKAEAAPRCEISLTTIDAFCEKNRIEQIDVLKMDIEGHEFKALMGGRKMLETHQIRFIQWEFSPYNIDSRTYFRDFFDLLSPFYSIYRVLCRGLNEIRRYDECHETFKVTNYLAVLKRGQCSQ